MAVLVRRGDLAIGEGVGVVEWSKFDQFVCKFLCKVATPPPLRGAGLELAVVIDAE
jgi:hypothetical protein